MHFINTLLKNCKNTCWKPCFRPTVFGLISYLKYFRLLARGSVKKNYSINCIPLMIKNNYYYDWLKCIVWIRRYTPSPRPPPRFKKWRESLSVQKYPRKIKNMNNLWIQTGEGAWNSKIPQYYTLFHISKIKRRQNHIQ
jgi:hypothetical protein